MGIILREHNSFRIRNDKGESDDRATIFSDEHFSLLKTIERKEYKTDGNTKIYPYEIKQSNESTYELKANYFVGLEWLIKGERYIQVEPKINLNLLQKFEEGLDAERYGDENENSEINIENVPEVNFLKMLLDIYSSGISDKQIENLVKIDWDATPIPINQQQDKLTPFLIVRFLGLLKSIVRKGLKKSYYKLERNLTSRIKGKILLGPHLKQNVLKNRQTRTFCAFQEFGINNDENKFLKKVFQFVLSYVNNNQSFYSQTSTEIVNMINYCRPAFELVTDDLDINNIRDFKFNPFFKEYKEAITIGNFILKRFAYNISTTSKTSIETPPFWIDMPRLFELYVYHKLLQGNNYDIQKIKFQFGTYGNYLDFLIKDGDNSMVIDAKYKLHYRTSVIHSDIRQVSGYARLKKVRQELNIDDDKNIPCLIIYPKVDATEYDLSIDNIHEKMRETRAYYKVYKLGIPLPIIN